MHLIICSIECVPVLEFRAYLRVESLEISHHFDGYCKRFDIGQALIAQVSLIRPKSRQKISRVPPVISDRMLCFPRRPKLVIRFRFQEVLPNSFSMARIQAQNCSNIGHANEKRLACGP